MAKKKKFNVTGSCLPHLHYMMDVSNKLAQIMEMVEMGDYFVINRPRQYGKTTMLEVLEHVFADHSEYIGLRLSFEDVSDETHQSTETFVSMFSYKVARELKLQQKELYKLWTDQQKDILDFNSLGDAISVLQNNTEKKIILLIDEVDASSNFIVFLRFLALLRNKFLERHKPGRNSFHSVILAGVHDIKSLKYKMRKPEEAQFNSPWNIAEDFKVNMHFTPPEIVPMLTEYAVAEDIQMDVKALADRLFYHTSGYPFLVTKLCKIIAEELLPNKEIRSWELADIEEAVRRLLKEKNTNFDSLIKNIANDQELYDTVFSIIVEGNSISFNPDNEVISKGILYGVFKRNGQVKIHNRIYEQRIYNYMVSRLEIKSKTDYSGHFLLEDKGIDLKAILLKFQQFMQAEYSKKDTAFLERNGRLVFLAFLNPILNGKGHTFKEVEISEEKRLDVVVTYMQHKFVIELKRWYGESYHQRGLKQLVSYLNKQNQDTGFLLIFEQKGEKTWRQEAIQIDGKQIFAVWV